MVVEKSQLEPVAAGVAQGPELVQDLLGRADQNDVPADVGVLDALGRPRLVAVAQVTEEVLDDHRIAVIDDGLIDPPGL